MNVIQRACLYIIEPKCVVFIFHVLAFPDSFALFVFQKPVISNSNASRIKIKLAQPVFLLHPRLKIAKVLLHFSNIRLSYHFVSMAMCKAWAIYISFHAFFCSSHSTHFLSNHLLHQQVKHRFVPFTFFMDIENQMSLCQLSSHIF